MPDRVVNRPKLAPGLNDILTAYYDLDTERNAADLAPIPWSKVVDYATFYDMDADELWYFIREADAAVIKIIAAKQKAQRGH